MARHEYLTSAGRIDLTYGCARERPDLVRECEAYVESRLSSQRPMWRSSLLNVPFSEAAFDEASRHAQWMGNGTQGIVLSRAGYYRLKNTQPEAIQVARSSGRQENSVTLALFLRGTPVFLTEDVRDYIVLLSVDGPTIWFESITQRG